MLDFAGARKVHRASSAWHSGCPADPGTVVRAARIPRNGRGERRAALSGDVRRLPRARRRRRRGSEPGAAASSAAPRRQPMKIWSASSETASRTRGCRRTTFQKSTRRTSSPICAPSPRRRGARLRRAIPDAARRFTKAREPARAAIASGATAAGLGPDLTDVGGQRRIAELEKSILDPGTAGPAEPALHPRRDPRRRHGHRPAPQSRCVHRSAPRFKGPIAVVSKVEPAGVRLRRQLADAVLSRQAERRGTGGPGQLPGFSERSGQPMTANSRVPIAAPDHRRCRPHCGRIWPGPGDLRPDTARRPGAAELADLLRERPQPASQPARRRSPRTTSRISSCSGCFRRGRSRSTRRRRSSSTACCTRFRRRTMWWRSMPRRDACSGPTHTRRRHRPVRAAAASTAGSRSSATRCSWRPSTPG